MESGTSFPSAGFPSVTTRKQRPRLLHTCGVSVLTIARKAYAKAEGLNSPIGSLTLTLTTHAGPFVNTLLSQWLAILCFTDDQILAAEKVVETLFPPSVYVFDKVDTIVHIAEILPGKFDNVVNLFEVMIHRVPFLDSAASQVIWVLNFLVSTLKDWGSDGAKEKDIMVDINCNEQRELASDKKPQTNEDEGINPTSIEKSLPPMDENGQTETTTGTVRNKSSLEGGANLKTYKEVLQMGNGGNVEKKEGDEKETGETMVCTGETPKGAEMDKGNVEKKEGDKKETQETMVCKGETPMEAEMDTNGPNKEVEEVPILELFDAGWHMKA